MPVCDDPNAFGFYVFKCDRKKPEDQKPKLKVKMLTRSKARAIQRELEEMRQSSTDDEAYFDGIVDVLLPVLVGWKNYKDGDTEVPFTKESFSDRLRHAELIELANNFMWAVAPTEDDLKN